MGLAKTYNSERGVSLVGVIVLTALIGIMVFMYIQQANSVRKREAMLQEQMYAQVHASELLETLRAFETWTILNTYLATTPYSTCAHLNILNRGNNTVVNPLPIANVESSTLKNVNRYVQIQFFDPNANSVESFWCNVAFNNRFGGFLRRVQGGINYDLNGSSDLRALIVVGVSWEASEAAGGGIQEVALSTLLPTLVPPP